MRFQELLAYQKSFHLAMRIFEITKTFPKEEIYSLTDQIRRSSRSVSANIAEAHTEKEYILKIFTASLPTVMPKTLKLKFGLNSLSNATISVRNYLMN